MCLAFRNGIACIFYLDLIWLGVRGVEVDRAGKVASRADNWKPCKYIVARITTHLEAFYVSI